MTPAWTLVSGRAKTLLTAHLQLEIARAGAQLDVS